MGDLDALGQREQLVLEIQDRDLAAVAGGELEDGEARALAVTGRAPRRSGAIRS